MLTTQSTAPSLKINTPAAGAFAPSESFCGLAGHAGLIASEFAYRKDEEIYGEDEPAEYVYQVIRGAVRTYKLLSDGRRRSARSTVPATSSG
jgi:CRP/FNR family nitrogen fixation transcriptional regulator